MEKRRLRNKKVADKISKWDSKVAGGLTNMVIDLITEKETLGNVMQKEFHYKYLGHPGPAQF
jgi:hypothetical protein